MSYTRPDLVSEVLERLGVYEVGQEPSPERYQMVDRIIPAVVATLRRDNVYSFSNLDKIPDEAFMPLAAIVAWDVKAKFSVAGESLATLGSDNADARPTLRRIRALAPDDTVVESDYF